MVFVGILLIWFRVLWVWLFLNWLIWFRVFCFVCVRLRVNDWLLVFDLV